MYVQNVTLFGIFYNDTNKKSNYFKNLNFSEIPGLPSFIYITNETLVNFSEKKAGGLQGYDKWLELV